MHATATAPASEQKRETTLVSGTSAPRWFRPTGADLVFLVLAVVIVQTARQTMLDDPGLGWHLRNVDAMREQGGWLTQDPFSLSPDGQPRTWLSNQWLGELPLWLGERWAGPEGIAAVATLILAFTLRCLYRMMLHDGLAWPVAVVWTALAALGTSCSWVARPNLFTMLFVLLTARVLEQYHAGKLSRGRTLWLCPLFAAWANIHGGFVAGLLMLAATLFIEAALAGLALAAEDRRAARERATHLAFLGIGAFLATLVNPYGPRLYHWVSQLLGDPFFMDLHQEWRSPDFHGKGTIRFELPMLLFPVLLGVSRRRPNLVELGLSVLWLHLAFTGFRYVPLWVLVATPLLARSSVEVPWLRAQAERLRQAAPDSFLFWKGRAAPGCVWSAVVAVALLGWARWREGTFAVHKPEIIPARALDRLLALHDEWQGRQGRPPVVFHSYNWGGYLTWHGWPRFRNWIDDRNEVQGKDHIRAYFALVEAEPGWQDRLAGVDVIALQPDAPLTLRLAAAAAWREVYRDPFAVLFERPGPLGMAKNN
jgi:hypothetical protein